MAPNFGQPGGGYQYYVPDPSVVRKIRKDKFVEEYKKELLKCIDLCEKEILNRSQGIKGESTV